MSDSLSKKDDSIGAINRVKILAAAEKEFAIHGFKGTRVQHIADRAELPKTNILYYFKSKDGLYLALLQEILSLWNSSFDNAKAQDDPAQVLAAYIADKMEISRCRPDASKIFALEIINGAPNLSSFFKDQHSTWMNSRVAVIQQWIELGKLPEIDPYYLLFNIWASSQHYADFSAQITELKGHEMDQNEFANATKSLIKLILQGCGLTVPKQYQ
ncbi:TetR/AcrR family transcriptional regulator [Paraglaciecola chathamensis]|jgi:TetR/AcrR family transcriptional regulator|uniref:TetR family transcriptional regulator n=2 Tax=Paraglaciecola chathamensis TaxID=368405 RepID=A0A8H9IBM6_9ALTE|nr:MULTISPECIES: TetR/AcrR family transcriptional regulator [Paraglaciecola]AEE22890.1 transcriptional regulator, TetR family [Glaciecola sp. 4H-3-7+YE-5]MBN25077.1 TetR/AcrR family transcriptional regulator [Alteromonadaceae bacterium]MBJ2137042.1 TetR family transcriptional regulator C-terminal domain-containing protein [Paraglaciecola chathamensis]MBU3019794.1 TetR/AcrR family transcriptional regulator [Paraglaciecola agarilytica]MDO6839233.1 TetR/AcrR family transcriptional regulator [Para|tara:strand:+ start:858 stop:1502 length:645 start_codon:yes stop_codon:yes gene_type:complete